MAHIRPTEKPFGMARRFKNQRQVEMRARQTFVDALNLTLEGLEEDLGRGIVDVERESRLASEPEGVPPPGETELAPPFDRPGLEVEEL